MNDRMTIRPEQARGTETRAIIVASAIAVLIGAVGVAGWLANGDTLFWSMLQAGLAWCL